MGWEGGPLWFKVLMLLEVKIIAVKILIQYFYRDNLFYATG